MISFKKNKADTAGLMRISELSRATGVSLPTIHFYVREGLLAPKIKTARNMAYYDSKCIEDIRLIKELQSKRFLPLSVIKLIVHAGREGQHIDHLHDMESLFTEIFQPVAGEAETKRVSFIELTAATGLSESGIKDLEDRGFLNPVKNEHEATYDDIDIRVARIFGKLEGFGLKPGDFDFYHRYMEIIRTEVRSVHESFHKLPNHEIVPLRELLKLANDLKRYLAMRVYRQEAENMHEHGFDRGKEG